MWELRFREKIDARARCSVKKAETEQMSGDNQHLCQKRPGEDVVLFFGASYWGAAGVESPTTGDAC